MVGAAAYTASLSRMVRDGSSPGGGNQSGPGNRGDRAQRNPAVWDGFLCADYNFQTQ